MQICYYASMIPPDAKDKNWGIIGHEYAIDLLRRTLAAEHVRHAYLFAGPEHIGKTLLAQRFAQTLLCTGSLVAEQHESQSPTASLDACNHCLSCQKVLHGNHPDLHIIARSPGKQSILIEQIRALQHAAARKPLEGQRSIFIIQEAQDMNLQAANCLLKTLEEPETDVVLLLTVPAADLLLPTILSRIQLIPMHLLAPVQITTALQERWQIEPKEASLIAALSAGRIGWAVRASEDDDLLTERQETLEMLTRVPYTSTVQRFEIAQRLSTDPNTLRTALEIWLLWWRDLLLVAHGCSDLAVNVDMRTLLQEQAAIISAKEAERMVQAIQHTREMLDQNVNARVALDVLMLGVPVIRSATTASSSL